MKIIKLTAENYKAFPYLEIYLEKINLIIGKNGAGKSSILRLAPIIIESIRNDKLDINPRGISLANSISDLLFKNIIGTALTLGLEFEEDRKVYSFRTSLLYDRDERKIKVSEFSFIDDEGEINYTKDFSSIGDFYLNENKKVDIDFLGLLPNIKNVKDRAKRERLEVLNSLKLHFNSEYLNYLGPFRKSPSRVYPIVDSCDNDTGIHGENSPYIIYNHTNNPNLEFIEDINHWTKENMEGSKLEIIKDQFSFSINVIKNSISSNIVDHGVGFSQILPLITSRFSRRKFNINGIEIIEQPELHLHPAMCGSIIDLYIDIVSEDNKICILETHSKETILRLRRRIAESKDNAIENNVQIIYVDQNENGSYIEYINILEDGSLSWWPSGVFEEAYEEIIAIQGIKKNAS
ncbi:hypothetical protein BCU98_14525 [Vibrio splendidus]|uniref:AAA family ATPase n=1 Tax=Vibrio splendidus TaxID=29497 RepID=UPI000C82405B|nr:AAA family ATPase [Vibrio splendidus]PMG16322.1 hypothetical protein BCU98_14525 [Vibrio splendidus]